MKLLLSLITLIFVSACGFEPVYGTLAFDQAKAQAVEEGLAQVEISNIPDREGQMLRNALVDRFYRPGDTSEKPYLLSVARLDETITQLDITRDSDTTREQLHLKTIVKLVEKNSGKTLIKRYVNAYTGYDVLDSQFSTRVGQNNAREVAINKMADRIETAIGLYFKD